MTENFYSRLQPLARLAEIAEPRNFTPAPADWYVVVSDIADSTSAINHGRYREVNLLGASVIAAVLNLAPASELPFIFNGDGGALLIPPTLAPAAVAALAGLQTMARREFGLELRAGVVPVAAILAEGHQLNIARFRISDFYAQAVFSGGGLAYAEGLIRQPEATAVVVSHGDSAAPVNLTGLECRWEQVAARSGEIICLLAMATPGNPGQESAIYRELFGIIEAIYGSEADYHPLAMDTLKMTFNPRHLLAETKLRTVPRLPRRVRYLWQIWFLNLQVRLYRAYQLVKGGPRWWDDYRAHVLECADYQKYDDTLRMVISSTPAQRERLESYLQTRYQQGDLVYGLHTTNRALLTCLVFERMGQQVHFVDGADGGYALAAQALKQRAEAHAAPPAAPPEHARAVGALR